tara:strand:+ start:8402 stop:8860 length:459 start_codon:yes stop_codon:yes gene_type:complete
MTDRAFHQGTYAERYLSMGDEAESQFEAHNIQWARYGFNRPDQMTKFYHLPHVIRYTPDYVQAEPNRLVEVMGMGKTPLKIKLEKLAAMQWWDGTGAPLYLWVWSSTRQNYAEIKFRDLMTLINKNDVPLGSFHEGKKYFSISSKLLFWNGD